MHKGIHWAALAALLLGSFALGYGLPEGAAHAKEGGNPLLVLAHDLSDTQPLTGQVEQTLRAGSYTYLALRDQHGELHWAVTLGGAARVGERVALRSLGHRSQFYSRRLHRTFETLRFGIVTRMEGEDHDQD